MVPLYHRPDNLCDLQTYTHVHTLRACREEGSEVHDAEPAKKTRQTLGKSTFRPCGVLMYYDLPRRVVSGESWKNNGNKYSLTASCARYPGKPRLKSTGLNTA